MRIYVVDIGLLVILWFLGAKSAEIDNSTSDDRILSGEDATFEKTKHQISLRTVREDKCCFGCGHICGGSLISPKVVVTAAHCVVSPDEAPKPFTKIDESELIVVMGTLNRFDRTRETEVREIDRIMLREDNYKYIGRTYDYDIAILILKQSMPMDNPNIGPIKYQRNAEVTENTRCTVTGWGYNEYVLSPMKLQTVEVKILNFHRCNLVYRGDLKKNTQVCAGYWGGGLDSCQGDSGGPLVCDNILTGVVSFGRDCGQRGYPGIYANVRFHSEWIDRVVRNVSNLEISEGTWTTDKKSFIHIIVLTIVMSFIIHQD